MQDYDLAGLSELEVMAVDMALGAACEVFVPDKVRRRCSCIAAVHAARKERGRYSLPVPGKARQVTGCSRPVMCQRRPAVTGRV